MEYQNEWTSRAQIIFFTGQLSWSKMASWGGRHRERSKPQDAHLNWVTLNGRGIPLIDNTMSLTLDGLGSQSASGRGPSKRRQNPVQGFVTLNKAEPTSLCVRIERNLFIESVYSMAWHGLEITCMSSSILWSQLLAEYLSNYCVGI